VFAAAMIAQALWFQPQRFGLPDWARLAPPILLAAAYGLVIALTYEDGV
jgi:hypothetical protein